MEYDDRVKLHVFDGKTTYLDDYRAPPDGTNASRIVHKWSQSDVEPEARKSACKYVQECHETFAPIAEGQYVPFDLLHEEKPIVGRGRKHSDVPINVEDLGKENAIKTRPRLYVAPAVSVDDVPDEKTRKLLLDYMYTTEFRASAQEAVAYARQERRKGRTAQDVSGCSERRVSLDEAIAEANRMQLPRQPHFPPIPDNFKGYHHEFDARQRRASVDPTAYFWRNKEVPERGESTEDPLENLVPRPIKDEIIELTRTNKLRLLYDKPIQGYAGYKCTTAPTVPMQSKEFPTSHPLLTTSQAVTSRFDASEK